MTKKSLIRMALVAIVAFAPAGAPAQEPAAEKDAAAANAELVGQLSKELSMTPTQAEGAAGSVFVLAKKRLKPEDFGKVAAAVPGMEALIKAAPLPDPKSAALDLATQGGGAASLASSLGKLGLKPEVAMKLVPAMSGYLKGKGAADAAQLVGGLLK
jgi:Protein of unknown function VcgC/VcgE (DUF2780)